MHGTDRPAWWRVHEGEPMVLRPFGTRWMAVWNAYRDRSQYTPRAALHAMAPGLPLPVGLSDDGTWTEPEAERTREAIALNPRLGDVVTDDSGRGWGCIRRHRWCAVDGVLRDADCPGVEGGVLMHEGLRLATLPDTLRGLARLNAASAVLDRRWEDVPDGVEVDPAWRGEDEPKYEPCAGCGDESCADCNNHRDHAEPDDRPVMAWETRTFSADEVLPPGWDVVTAAWESRRGGLPGWIVLARRRVEVPRG